jgi:hypothetical protein
MSAAASQRESERQQSLFVHMYICENECVCDKAEFQGLFAALRTQLSAAASEIMRRRDFKGHLRTAGATFWYLWLLLSLISCCGKRSQLLTLAFVYIQNKKQLKHFDVDVVY